MGEEAAQEGQDPSYLEAAEGRLHLRLPAPREQWRRSRGSSLQERAAAETQGQAQSLRYSPAPTALARSKGQEARARCSRGLGSVANRPTQLLESQTVRVPQAQL